MIAKQSEKQLKAIRDSMDLNGYSRTLQDLRWYSDVGGTATTLDELLLRFYTVELVLEERDEICRISEMDPEYLQDFEHHSDEES